MEHSDITVRRTVEGGSSKGHRRYRLSATRKKDDVQLVMEPESAGEERVDVVLPLEDLEELVDSLRNG